MYEDLREIMKKDLQYPDNHDYDPDTFTPQGKLSLRVERLRRNAPELFAGGKSLLEIGSNKGYFCMTLAKVYGEIHGYDKAKEYTDFCWVLAKMHGISNVRFYPGSFRDIPFDRTYEVVYVGNCHHYFFLDCARNYAPPLLFLKKLAGLTEKYLILDGPFELKDPAVSRLIKEGSWSEYTQEMYTFEKYVEVLAPQFQLIRKTDNGLGRETAVFERILPDFEYIDGTNLRRELIRKGVLIECNPNRGPDSMFLFNNLRYKFDMNPPPDSVFLILNALPRYFPKIRQIITYRGARVGDVADWIYGEKVEDGSLLENILRINMILGSVGLIELDLERDNFKIRNDHVYDIDVDMVRSIAEIVSSPPIEETMKVFLTNKIRRLGMRQETIDYLVANISKPDIFREILKKGDFCETNRKGKSQ